MLLRPMLLAALLLLAMAQLSAAVGLSPGDVPSPMANPQGCGRIGVKRSSVCDVDNMMTSEDKDVIEGYINKIENDEVAVLMIKKMAPSFIGSNSVERASERFAREVHDSWGVGRKGEDNGALIFLSIDDRAVFISVGKGERQKLNGAVLDALISKMKEPLRSGLYGKAVEQTVVAMQLLLSSEEARRTYTQPKTSDYTFFIVFAAVFAGMWGYSSYESSRMHGLRVGRAALEKLMKEVRMEQDFVNGTAAAAAAAPPRAVDSSGRAVFMSQSCPICLEDFPSPAAEETLPDPRRPMALQCGHTFCHECLDDFLKQRTGDACPVCRAPVAPAAARQPLNDNATGDASGSHYGGPSCSSSSGGGGYSREFLESRALEHRFRLGRIRLRYPRLLDIEAARVLDSSLSGYSGSSGSNVFLLALEMRSSEVGRIVASYEARKAAAAAGSGGSSRSSFGGGHSSGGRGGRW